MNIVVVQTRTEAFFIQLLALMFNIVLSCIKKLNFIILSMNWDSCANDVTGYTLNPLVSISDKRELLAASSVPATLKSVGERRTKVVACDSSSSSGDGYKIYYHHARWTHLWLVAETQENFTWPCSRCVVIWGSGGLVPTTPYVVSRWRWSASYPCCFTSGERARDSLWIRCLVGHRTGL